MKISTNKRISWMAVPGLIILALPVFFLNNQLSERQQYENFVSKELQTMPFMNTDTDKPMPDNPFMAGIQNYYQMMDPETKTVPRERMLKAYEETKHLASMKATNAMEWSNVPSNMGGRTRALVSDPGDPSGNKAWCGGVTGGLWYTNDITDPNEDWVAVDDFWPNLSISSIAFDPADSQTMYVGTGEAHTAIITYRSSSGLGMGILKSTDGGATWAPLESTADFAYVTDIAIRQNGDVSEIYAGVTSGIYMGEDHNSTPTDGLFKSIDGGESWTQVLPNIEGTTVPYSPSDIEIGGNNRIYIGTMPNIDRLGGAVIFYSNVGDADSWTINTDYKELIENDNYYIPGRVLLSSSDSDPTIVYSLIASGFVNNGIPYFNCNYILRSESSGSSWTQLNIPPNGAYGSWATIAWHALAIDIDPNDPNTLYIGGLDVYKSTDTGESWTKVSDWVKMYYNGGDDYVHGDIHTIQFLKESSEEIMISSDGGVFYSSTALNSEPVFIERSKSMNTLQCYVGAITPTAGDENYLSGHQDNGTVNFTGEPLTVSDMISGGDGAYCFIDQDQPDYYISSSQYNNYTIFYQGSQIFYLPNFDGGNFISAADYDYRRNILFANNAFFWDYNMNTIIIYEDILSDPQGAYVTLLTNVNSPFTHVKFSPFSPEESTTIFLGTGAGSLFKVENAAGSQDVSEIGSNDFPTATISCVAIGGSEDTLLVTFSNFGVSSVWQTYDGGANWDEKEAELPDMPIRWAIYHPQNSKQVLLATENGIWATYNINDPEPTWMPEIEGLANVRVDMLKIRESDNTVLAVSHGRGLFTAHYALQMYTGIDENIQNEIAIYPNPVETQFTLKLQLKESTTVRVNILDINGKVVYSDNYTADSGMDEQLINIENLVAGVYFINCEANGKIHSQKIVKK